MFSIVKKNSSLITIIHIPVISQMFRTLYNRELIFVCLLEIELRLWRFRIHNIVLSFTVGRTEANLDDVGLAFRYMNIDIPELVEYVKNVDSVSCPTQVPRFPVRRENHLNFLKPGSREVVTRPVHIHEHLPAMYPDTEGNIIIALQQLRDNCNKCTRT